MVIIFLSIKRLQEKINYFLLQIQFGKMRHFKTVARHDEKKTFETKS